MNWVFGIIGQGPGFRAELLSREGAVSEAPLDVLTKHGIPASTRRARVMYEGDFSDWACGDASKYLNAVGIKQWPLGTSNRHEVFEIRTSNGLTLHVPALVLMRAFFWPANVLFRIAFKPSNVGLVSFVDYAESTPRVVVDNASLARRLRSQYGASQQSAVNWMQMSRSAQRMVRSAHDNAALGCLKLAIPDGKVRISFVGHRNGEDVFVADARLFSVVVPAEDTISGADVSFEFAAKCTTKAVGELVVPRRGDGDVRLTCDEWRELEPLLAFKGSRGKLKYTPREVFDLILRRMGRRSPTWASLATAAISVETLCSRYLAWSSNGSLELALTRLRQLRPSPSREAG